MTDDATPREVGSHAWLGLAPERTAFEEWCCKRWGGDRDALRIRDMAGSELLGEYVSGPVQFAWEAWQASRAAERERCAKLAEEYATWGGSNFHAWFTKLAAAIRA